MTANKKGTVAIPDEGLAGTMIHMRLPLRHVAFILEQGLVCGLVEGKKGNGTVNTYEVRGEDFNQIANLLHYHPDQLTITPFAVGSEDSYLELSVDWTVYTDKVYAPTGGDVCPTNLKPVFEIGFSPLAAAMEQNIWYFNAHTSIRVWTVGQCPHFIISTYTNGGTIRDEVFGITLPGSVRDGGTINSNLYKGQESSVLTSPEGTEFALFTQARLFIYPDLPHREDYDLATILSGIVGVMGEMYGDPEEIAARKVVAFKSLLGGWLSTVPERRMREFKNNLESAERELNDAERRLVDRRKRCTDAQFAYTTNKANKKELFDVGKAVDEVIDLVERSKEFTAFSGVGEWLEVETGDIFIPHPYDGGDEYYMGRYRIRINPVACVVQLPMAHQPPEKMSKHMVHPHASSSDDICWGNVGTPIYKLIEDGKFVEAIHLITNYLRHVNGHEETMENYWYTKAECEEKGVVFE